MSVVRRRVNFFLAVASMALLQVLIYSVGSFAAFQGVDSRGVYLLQIIASSQGLQLDLIAFAAALLALYAGSSALTVAHYQWFRKRFFYPARLSVLLTILWFALFSLVLILLNTIVAPQSVFAFSLAGSVSQNSWLFQSTVLCLLLVFAPTSFVIWHLRRRLKHKSVVLLVSVAVAVVVAQSWSALPSRASKQPDVILVGIDSFSLHELNRYKEGAELRNLYSRGAAFSDVITPMGRTFPAWVSIFTGKTPLHHGARENLIPFDMLNNQVYLPEVYRQAGYRTLYAMDERQFSNLDDTFGFDEVVGPAVGAADFILSRVSDLPVVNVIIKIPYLGKVLFPYAYANRARRQNYDPVDFDRDLSRAVAAQSGKPLFLSVHFCLPHVPFEWAGAEISRLQETELKHAQAIARVTRQVQNLMRVLKENRRLENAYVIFLSDHGEGVNSLGAIVAGPHNRHGGAQAELAAVRVSFVNGFNYGHGINLLNRDETDPFLFVHRYESGVNTMPARTISEPVSLIDIAPTLLDLTGLGADHLGRVEGVSLGALLTGQNAETAHKALQKRVRYMENGIYFSAMGNTVTIDEDALIHQAAKYYEVNPAGRMQLIRSTYANLIKEKTRAAIIGAWQLTLIPTQAGETVTVLSHRDTQEWTLDLYSDWAAQAPVNELIKSLKGQYGQELASWDPGFIKVDRQVASWPQLQQTPN